MLIHLKVAKGTKRLIIHNSSAPTGNFTKMLLESDEQILYETEVNARALKAVLMKGILTVLKIHLQILTRRDLNTISRILVSWCFSMPANPPTRQPHPPPPPPRQTTNNLSKPLP